MGVSNGKVNDHTQNQVMLFPGLLPISKNTIKDTLLLLKALFKSEAELKNLKNMHKKTLNDVFGRHFAWMKASVSYISNCLYKFAAVISTQNIHEQALSCFILIERTYFILGLLTLKKHISVSLGFWFVCLCLGWPQPCCLQNSSAPTYFAAFRSVQLWFIVWAGQTHPLHFWGHSVTAGQRSLPSSMSRQGFCKRTVQCSWTAKQSARKWVLVIRSWRRYLDGKVFQGRNYVFVLMSQPVRAYLLSLCIGLIQ